MYGVESIAFDVNLVVRAPPRLYTPREPRRRVRLSFFAPRERERAVAVLHPRFRAARLFGVAVFQRAHVRPEPRVRRGQVARALRRELVQRDGERREPVLASRVAREPAEPPRRGSRVAVRVAVRAARVEIRRRLRRTRSVGSRRRLGDWGDWGDGRRAAQTRQPHGCVARVRLVPTNPQRVQTVPGERRCLNAVSVKHVPFQHSSRVWFPGRGLRSFFQSERRALASAARRHRRARRLVRLENRVRLDVHFAHHVHPDAAGDDVVHVHRGFGPRVPLTRARQLEVQTALHVHLHVAAVKLAGAHALAVHRKGRPAGGRAEGVERRDGRVVHHALAHHADALVR